MAGQKSTATFTKIMNIVLPPQSGKVPHKTGHYAEVRSKGAHGGVDFNYEGGQAGINMTHPKVMSPVSGKVVYATGGSFGTVKIVDSNGFSHEIMHLHTRTVKNGQMIKAGEMIGSMGSTGSKHQHVHYQLKDAKGRLLNPEKWWNERKAPAVGTETKSSAGGNEPSKGGSISDYRNGMKSSGKTSGKSNKPGEKNVDPAEATQIPIIYPSAVKTKVASMTTINEYRKGAKSIGQVFEKTEANKTKIVESGSIAKIPTILPTGVKKAVKSSNTIGDYRSGAKSVDKEATVSRKTGPASKEEQLEFLKKFLPEAKSIEKMTGLPASFILGKISLETGWAKKELPKADGSPSYNLFNIKAYSSWKGEKLTALVPEVVKGKEVLVYQNFKVYKNHAEAFADYGKTMANDKRYAAIRGETDPAKIAAAMKKYATNPNYDKALVTQYKQVNNTLLKLEAAGEVPKGSAVPVTPKKTAEWQPTTKDVENVSLVAKALEKDAPQFKLPTDLVASNGYNYTLPAQALTSVASTNLPKLGDLLSDSHSLDGLLGRADKTNIAAPAANPTAATHYSGSLYQANAFDEFFA